MQTSRKRKIKRVSGEGGVQREASQLGAAASSRDMLSPPRDYRLPHTPPAGGSSRSRNAPICIDISDDEAETPQESLERTKTTTRLTAFGKVSSAAAVSAGSNGGGGGPGEGRGGGGGKAAAPDQCSAARRMQRGDTLRVLACEDTVRTAFGDSDVSWQVAHKFCKAQIL